MWALWPGTVPSRSGFFSLFRGKLLLYVHRIGCAPFLGFEKFMANCYREQDAIFSIATFYGIPKDRLLSLTRGKPVVHSHTPVERIYYDAVRMNCDLGSNTYFLEEGRGLALVNLSQMSYVVYKQHARKLEMRTIARFRNWQTGYRFMTTTDAGPHPLVRRIRKMLHFLQDSSLYVPG